MTVFVKKPETIEAHRWFKNGDHPRDYSVHDEKYPAEERKKNNWEGDVVRYYRTPEHISTEICDKCGNRMHLHGFIDNFNSGYDVCPGDWVIKGTNGNYYSLHPDVFDMLYERVK